MAIDYRTMTLKSGSLLLDPKNTRIPVDRRSTNQRSLLHALLRHEDVKSLAASIAKQGVYPHERLIVMQEGRRFVVLEGNRRLAAVKLLISPELAPTDATVKYFRRLSAKADLTALAKLDVVVVPTRVAAAAVIASLHIGDSKKRWSSLQQARFYREMVDEGQSPGEIAEEAHMPLGQVNSALRSEKLYRLALPLAYEDDVRAKLEDARFPLTTLERFIESKNGRKFLGIELDDEKGFLGVVHPDRFNAVLRHVVTDIVTDRSMTRRVNTKDDFDKYIAESSIPKTKMRGKFDPDVLLGDASPDDDLDSSTEQEVKPPRRRVVKPSKSVIPRGFTCNPKCDRARAIFKEIGMMDIEQQRNSTAVMLRVLIEVALWSYMERNGHDSAACDHFDKDRRKRKHKPNWTPALRDLISYACEKRILSGVPAHGYRSIRSLAAKDADYVITVDGFNAFTHNTFTTPLASDLRALWERAAPMLDVILND